MITDAVIRFLWGIVHALLEFIPTFVVPDWFSSATGAIATVFDYAGLMGAWFPVTLVRNVVLAVLTVWLISFGVKVTRIIASFFTAGGGSAG